LLKSKLIFAVELYKILKMKKSIPVFLFVFLFGPALLFGQTDSTATPDSGTPKEPQVESQPPAEPQQPASQEPSQTTTQKTGRKGGPRQARNEVNSVKNRIYFGGSLGLQFGTVTYIEVSPIIGYRITEKLRGGIGLRYIYYKYDDDFLSSAYESSIYGGSIFGSYYIIPSLFAHVEFEMLNLEVPENVSNTGDYNLVRDWIASTMVGGGYAQSLGGRSALTFMVLWNLTEEQYSPYSNPVIRIGVNVGL
jgi:hypothetical protein